MSAKTCRHHRVVFGVFLAERSQAAYEAPDSLLIARHRFLEADIQQALRQLVAELACDDRTDALNGVPDLFGLRIHRRLLFLQFVGHAHSNRRFLRRRHLPVFLCQALDRAAGLRQHPVVTLAGLGSLIGVIGQHDIGAGCDDQQRPERGHGHARRHAERNHRRARRFDGAGHGQHGRLHLHRGDGIGRHRRPRDVDGLQQLHAQVDGSQHLDVIDDDFDGAGNLAERRHQQRTGIGGERAHGAATDIRQQFGDDIQGFAGRITEAAAAGKALDELAPSVLRASQGRNQVSAHRLSGAGGIAERGNHPVTELR